MAYQELYEAILKDNGPAVRELLSCQLVDSRCIFVSHTLSLTGTDSSNSEPPEENVQPSDLLEPEQCLANSDRLAQSYSPNSRHEQIESGDSLTGAVGGSLTGAVDNKSQNVELSSSQMVQKSGLQDEFPAPDLATPANTRTPEATDCGAVSVNRVETRPEVPRRTSLLRLGPKLLPVPGLSSRSGDSGVQETDNSSVRNQSESYLVTASAAVQPPCKSFDDHVSAGSSLHVSPSQYDTESSQEGAVGGTTVMQNSNLACTEIWVEEVSDSSPDVEHADQRPAVSSAQGTALHSDSAPRRKQYRFKFDSSSLSDSEDSPPGVNPLEGLDITDIRFSELKLHSGARLEDWHRAEVALVDAQHFLRTPLTLAARCGSRVVMEVLLWGAVTADVYQQDGWLQSALHMVLWSGDTHILELMVKQGCDVTQPFEDGCTPLHLAAKYGKQACVEVLLRSGSLINAEDFQERTPLHMASSHGHPNCLQALLQAGANVNHLDCHNNSALHSTGNVDCVNLLLSAGARPNSHFDTLDLEENTAPRPLEIVTHHAKENHTKVVGVLLDAGFPANVDHPWLRGRDSPLHWAICNASSECVNLLLKANAGVDAKNSCGNTPLMVSSTRYHTLDKRANYDDVQRLIDAGCDLNIANDAGQSALHMATKCRNLEFVKILVKNNANVDVVDSRSRTALMYTAMLSSADVLLYWNLGTDWEVVYIAKLLLQANCNVHLRDKYRRTALVLAIPEVSVNGPQISEPLVTLLVMAGSKIPPKKVTSAWKKASSHSRLDAHEKQALSKVVRIMTWLDTVRSNPVSLQQKCRLVVRRCLGTPIHSRAAQLNLPSKLRNYILLKDLDEVVEGYWRAHDTSDPQGAAPQIPC